MTTTVFFVRHVPHEHQGRIHVGRSEGVALAPDASVRLAAISQRFTRERLDAVYSSPISRAELTARAIAGPRGLQVQTREGLTEIDTGDWTGRSFAEVDAEPTTKSWNAVRSMARIPGGESDLEVQARVVGVLEELREIHSDQHVALVSHGDPLVMALLYLLGMPIDAYDRISIDPGSVSAASIGNWGAKIHFLNDTSHFRTEPAVT